MPRFFVNTDDIQGTTVTLSGTNAHHASYSLRLAVGDTITVCDQIRVYQCRLTAFDGECVRAEILSSTMADTEPPYRAVLYQALPKGDKLDTIIQKAVECGVSEIVPFVSSRCVVQRKPEAEARKTERRRRIAEEAAKQSGRGIIPTVLPVADSFADVIREASAADLPLFCYEGIGTRPIGDILRTSYRTLCDRTGDERPTVAIIIGSEGGFSPDEAKAAGEAGLNLVGLGRRILRTETASSFVLSCLSYQYEL